MFDIIHGFRHRLRDLEHLLLRKGKTTAFNCRENYFFCILCGNTPVLIYKVELSVINIKLNHNIYTLISIRIICY